MTRSHGLYRCHDRQRRISDVADCEIKFTEQTGWSRLAGPRVSFSPKIEAGRGIRSSLSDITFGITATRPAKTESYGIPNPALRIGIGEEGYVRQTKSARAVCACMVA
jgi:hypothetical protein